MAAANSRASYMRHYRKQKRLAEDNCNDVPKRTKLNAERQSEYSEIHKNISAEYMRNYRKRKVQENLRKTDLFQYKSQFHYVFNVNPGSQGSRYFFLATSLFTGIFICAYFGTSLILKQILLKYCHALLLGNATTINVDSSDLTRKFI
jgi:hypothetical protein